MAQIEIGLLVLTVVFGVLLFGPTIYAFFGFVHTHFIHRSTIKTYLHSPRSYALITGASDGIGKELATELLKIGFNVVIHGRNAAKLEGVKQELLGLKTGKDILVWVADSGIEQYWDGVPSELRGLEITVLINNVGGAQPPTVSFDEQTWQYVQTTINVNAVFPMRLTHSLLPSMRALAGPTLVLTTGSIAGELPPPWMMAYSSSKAFLDMFVRSMDVQERVLLKSKVHFHLLQTASVLSGNGFIKKSTWDTPTADVYAKACLGIVGCGKRKICPWWGHALERWVATSLPEPLADAMMLAAMDGMNKAQKTD